MKNKIIDSSGNVFSDLGFPPEEAALLALRAELIACLRQVIADKNWNPVQAATALGIAQPQLAELMGGTRDSLT